MAPTIRFQSKPKGDMFSLFAVLAAVVGLIAGWVAVEELWISVKVLRWPTVQGSLEPGQVREWEVHRKTGRSIAYEAVVSCAFEVDGTRYFCERIHPVAMKFGSREAAASEVRSAKSSTVHYNPSNPADSCLTAMPNDRCLWCLGACVVGLALLVFAIRRQRRNARAFAEEIADRQRMVDEDRRSGTL